jgi:hypothetical protein
MKGLLRWMRDNDGLIAAIGAVAVGLGALYFSWVQAKLMRVEQETAVWPALQIDGFNDRAGGDLRVGFRVENAGVGPALIRTVEVTRDGAPIESYEAIAARFPAGASVSNMTMTGRILAAGATAEPVALFWGRDAASDSLAEAAAEEGRLWRMDLCYCSAFGRCWTTYSGRVDPPEEVRACPADAPGRF